MHVDYGILGKLTRLVMFLLFVAGTLAVAVWYMPLIRQNERMRQQIFELDAKIQKEQEIARNLKNATDALRGGDPKALERLARERLGYARPGEIVIRFEPDSSSRGL